MKAWIDLHRELYNNALEERRNAYRDNGVKISYIDQQNALPALKQKRPELIPLDSQALQETLRKLDRAFKAFFRRVSSGQKSGYPRFKGKDRFQPFTYPGPAGWKFLIQDKKKAKLFIRHLGNLKMRGNPRVAIKDGEPRTLTIKNKAGRWYATIQVRFPMKKVARPGGDIPSFIGLDAGSKTLLYTSEGEAIDHPKFLIKSHKKLISAQKALSRKKKGSQNRQKAKRKVSKLHRKVTNQRKSFLHQLSSELATNHSIIAVEDLDMMQVTKSARGTTESPGKNVKQKAALNRSLLDGAFGSLYNMLEYKAEEAGIEFVKVDPKYTSQDCTLCDKRVPKKTQGSQTRLPLMRI